MTGGGSSGASALRQQQQQTDQRINQGMQSINAIFDGGTYGSGAVTKPVAGTSYYDLQGQAVPGSYTPGAPGFSSWLQGNEKDSQLLSPQQRGGGGGNNVQSQGGGFVMGGGHGDRPGQPPPNVAGNQQKVWMDYLNSLGGSGGLFSQTNTSKGFDDAFYQQAGNAFENFALPQLATQFDQQNRTLQAGLANRGVTGGSSARRLTSSLQNETGLQKQNIANQALGMEQSLRQQVGNEKNTVVNQLISSQNPGLAAQQAIAAASQLSAPSPLPAIGNLFQSWANTYLGGQLNAGYGQNPYSQQVQRQPGAMSTSSGPGYGNVGG